MERDTLTSDLEVPVINETVFQRTGDIFGEIRGLDGFRRDTLGQALGNKYLLQSESFQTSGLLQEKIYRTILSLLIKVYLSFARLKSVYAEVGLLFNIVTYEVWIHTKANSTVLNSRVGYVKMILDFWSFVLNVLENFPPVIYIICQLNLFSSTPADITEFQCCIPSSNLPQSIGLVISLNDAVVSPPPIIPKPYLDGDKRIQVPATSEVQSVLAARSEYFTHQSTHLAAEKVRLLSEIGRFVTWAALVPNIDFINIYEPMAVLWGPKGDHKTLQNAINNELTNYASSTQTYELLPKIILINRFSGKEHEVEMFKTFNKDLRGKRELCVYLSDLRGEELVLNKIKQHLDNADLFQNVYPPATDLLVVACRENKDSKLLGFRNLDNTTNNTIVYFSPFRFGFKFFARSLYYYALYDDQEVSCQNSGSSTQSIFSYTSQMSTNYLVRFFDRVRTLRKFDLSSSDDKSCS